MKVHKTKPEPKQNYSPQVLTDLAIKNLRPKVKDGKPIRAEVRDTGTENQLYLLIQPSGHKSFAFRYERGGKSIRSMA
jgi:hypothetical protein